MPRIQKSYFLLFLAAIASVFLDSCSVEKNTAATRSFHNLTSHYNIYFNATESFKKGLIRAEESYIDDFTSLLPIFFYEDESIQQSISPQMKRAIDKSTKVITFHSIKAKPKIKEGKQTEEDKEFYEKDEYNKWVDDCYLLVGKSYMYQGEFFLAAESFKHVIKTFPDENAYYLALPWLIRAYNVIGELDDSEELIVALKDMDEYPKEDYEVLYTSLADYYMRMEKYEEAASYLEKVLETRPKKNKRIRYTFILAQLYKEFGNGEASIKNYKKVIRMNPPYVMAFNSKVSMAEAFESGSAGSEEIKKLLNKMLKDSKNNEFQDQIYYALGNISMEEGDREKAIDYYHKSVTASVQNNYQKGQSCLTLAEIYYNEPIYTLSAAYYDTAVNLLDEGFPNYRNLSTRSRSLNSLVTNITTFELQDSVQKLANMSEVERFAVIDGIIQKVREEEEEARLKQQEAMQDLAFSMSDPMYNNSGFGTNTQSTGKWYFYNLNAKSFGQPEFRLKWGDRKLEDNWRRSNKQSMTELIDEANPSEANGENGESQIIDNKSREYYLRDIPLTDSAMLISNVKLEEALYNMGMIYRDDLLDYRKAIEAFEIHVSKFPNGNYTMPTYYYLHDLYNTVQEPAMAEKYKNLLSTRFPASHMAKLLTNPNYINELEEEQNKVTRFYESVYEQYTIENYQEVISLAETGLEIYKDQVDMLPRLTFMKAIATGALLGKEAMKSELDSLLAWYPESEVAAEAKEMIEYMYIAFPVIKEADQVKEAVEIYKYDLSQNHQFMLAVRKSENMNLVNFNLLNYNLDNYNNYDLKIKLENVCSDYRP